MSKKNGNTGIHVETKAPKLPVDIIVEIAAGFVSILEAGAENRLEQSTIQRAIDGFANIVKSSQPSNFNITGCSISNGA